MYILLLYLYILCICINIICLFIYQCKVSVILACRQLIRVVMESNITEIHADATFKVVPANMGNQLLSIYCMFENYVSYYFIETNVHSNL